MSGPTEATGAILGGGASRRMGRDKLSLKVGDTTLLDRVHGALASRCTEILIVGGGGCVSPETRYVSDLRPGRQGPLAGIEAGLLAARHRTVFIAAGDMPFLTGDLVNRLLDLLSDHTPAVVPHFRGRVHPLCAAYGQEAQPAVSGALDRGMRSVRRWLDCLPGVRYVGEEELRHCGDPNLLLMNVNSPEDLTRAQAALREGLSHHRA